MESRQRAVLWMELDEWKQQVAKGVTPDPAYALQKSVVGEWKAVDNVERGIRFVVSRNSVDRDNDVINQTGWDLVNFLKNPVVPFAHDYKSLPVAKAVQTSVEGDELVSVSQFVSRDVYPFADTVYQMVKGGFLNAVSAGFKPKKFEMNKERGGVDFFEQELLEYSVVPIPSNPDALVQARSLGIDLDPLKKWAERVLDIGAISGVWLPHKQVEQMYWCLSPFAVPVAMSVTSSTTGTGPEPEAKLEPTQKSGDKPESVVKYVPRDVSQETADVNAAWSRPTLSDFTDKQWDDLTAAEKRLIAGHFAYSVNNPPQTFGDLRLPHHRPSDGRVVWNGVRAAMGALLGARGGADIPDADRRSVYNHLSAHYRRFDREPPELRAYESDDEIWKACGPEELVEEVESQPDESSLSDEVEKVLQGLRMKVNPVVLNNPLPGSYEWQVRALREQLPNYLSRNGVEFRPDHDMAVIFSTYPTKAFFCIVGQDRPFSEDPCYVGAVGIAEDTNVPHWAGEPQRVDIEISFDVVQAQMGAAASTWKKPSEKSKDAQDAVVWTIELKDDGGSAQEEMRQQQDVVKSIEKVVPLLVKEEIRNAVRQTIRQLQGKVD